MSTRDQGLLHAAGLSIAQAAELLGRTRQALYTGLSQGDRDYFTADNAQKMLRDARRHDSVLIDGLIKFIRDNYPQSESELVLPDQMGSEQLGRVVAEADEIIVGFNGNTENLVSEATFGVVLKDLIDKQRPLRFLAPEWARGYIKQHLKVEVPAFIEEEGLTYLPSFLLTKKQGTYRAFFFLRFSAEETRLSEATGLWEHFASMCLETAADTARKSA